MVADRIRGGTRELVADIAALRIQQSVDSLTDTDVAAAQAAADAAQADIDSHTASSNPHTYLMWGTGSPEGAITAGVGTIFLRTDGGASTTLYVKESGSGNTGWVAK